MWVKLGSEVKRGKGELTLPRELKTFSTKNLWEDGKLMY